MAWQLFRTVLNRWRVSALGLPPRSFWGAFPQNPQPDWPVVNGFSPKVVPRPADWGSHIHTTGWWLPDDPDWQPPAGLLRFLEAGPAPVFIGFGSMPVADPRKTTGLILEAVRQAGVRAILHTGWAGLGSGSPHGDPPGVFSIDYAPYAWLFPRMSAILHHGGSGTTGLALHSGVPSAIVPFLFDQFYWAERSAALGVGPRPLSFRRLTVERLAAMLVDLTTNPAYRQPAQTLAAALRTEDGVGLAVQMIEELSILMIE